MHFSCLKEYKKSNWGCPICRKSLVDMKLLESAIDAEIAATIMPQEYRNSYMNILCQDC